MPSSRAVQTCSLELEQWQCRVIAVPLSITQHHFGRKLIIFSDIQPQNGKMKTCLLKHQDVDIQRGRYWSDLLFTDPFSKYEDIENGNASPRQSSCGLWLWAPTPTILCRYIYCVNVSIRVSALVYQHLQFSFSSAVPQQLHLLPAAKRFYCEELIKVKYQPSPSWRPE